MKRLLFILPLLTLLARCTPQVETTEPTVPDTVPELVEGPFQASPALSTIDSLMWHQLDSAFALLLQFAGSPEADSLDTFNMNYFQVLLSELLYKNDCAQSNRNELLQAVACFDSFSSTLNAHPFAPSRHSGPDPESPSPYDDLPFLAARAHYINGVGYYESDSLVPACAEYLKALEVMEDRYKEKELVGHKARFMAYTFNRLGDMFSGQYMMKPAIDCYENALAFCLIEPTSSQGIPRTLYNIGRQYDKLGDANKAKDYYEQALNEIKDFNSLVYRDLLSTKALFDYRAGLGTESSLARLRQAISQSQSEKERMSRFFTIGVVFSEEKMYDSALLFLEPVFEHGADKGYQTMAADYLQAIYDTIGNKEKEDVCVKFLAKNKEIEGENKALVSELENLYKTYTERKKEIDAKKARDKAVRRTFGILLPIALALVLAIVVLAKLRAHKHLNLQQEKANKTLTDVKQEYGKELKLVQAAREEAERKQESLRQDLQLKEDQINELETALSRKNEESKPNHVTFIDEEICQRIKNQLYGKHITTRDSSYQHHITLDEEDYKQLKEAVERHYKGFDKALLDRCSKLKQNDLILCHLFLLGLEECQIFLLMDRTYSAVKKQSKSLQKKLGVGKDVSKYVLKVAEELTTDLR